MVNSNTKLSQDEYYAPDVNQGSSPIISLVDDKLKLTLILRDFDGMQGSISVQEFITNKLNSLLNRVSNVILSKREVEILENAALGKSNKQIAQILCISESTVKNELCRIMGKTHVNDRTQAVVWALINGWLDIKNIAQKFNETTLEETTEKQIDEEKLELKDKVVRILNKKIW
jgi:DNA-binding CsgD family transcriptional regulator